MLWIYYELRADGASRDIEKFRGVRTEWIDEEKRRWAVRESSAQSLLATFMSTFWPWQVFDILLDLGAPPTLMYQLSWLVPVGYGIGGYGGVEIYKDGEHVEGRDVVRCCGGDHSDPIGDAGDCTVAGRTCEHTVGIGGREVQCDACDAWNDICRRCEGHGD